MLLFIVLKQPKWLKSYSVIVLTSIKCYDISKYFQSFERAATTASIAADADYYGKGNIMSRSGSLI